VTLPVVHVDGTPYDQGRQHGQALRERIAHNLDIYYDRFLREGQLEATEARARAKRYVPLLHDHPYFDAVRGVADGSGFDLIDVLVLNLRYELLYYQYGMCAVGAADGCTSFALLPVASANGHLLLGQNWDWIPEVAGAVLHTREPDGLEILSFTEAGIVGGKIGLNSAGLGLAINGLLSTADDWSRLVMPFHVRCYQILRQREFESAVAVVTEQPRACSANFLIAQAPDRVMNLETAPEAVRALNGASTITHSNHFLDPSALGVIEPPGVERRPHTYQRLSRIQELLDARAPVSIGDLESILRDHDNHPDGLCRHIHPDDPPEEWCTTVTSVIMDLDARTLWLTDGQPCQSLYERSDMV
jgi:isopenicillin-N N-acyltransferase-like protein